MTTRPLERLLACLLLLLAVAFPTAAADSPSPLVSVEWLRQNHARPDLLILDASSSARYTKAHIPGAVSVDLFRFGAPHKVAASEMERRMQSWGISAARKVVIYDEGGGQTAPWLFYELYYHGFPVQQMAILDGGLAKWQAGGGAVTTEPTKPTPGDFRVVAVREEARVRMPEFLAASGDRARHALVEALGPEYHYGDIKFFDRPGHIPNAIMWPTPDFYNADKTFKSPEEIRRMARYLGVTPERQVHSHCGGGIAATVPFFALKFLAGYPQVRLFKESQIDWLQDERHLPMWTYDAPHLRRELAWINSWGGRMTRAYGVSEMSIIDVRAPEAYDAGHVPFAVNIPAETFRAAMNDPARLAETLGAAGVNPDHEAVIVSEGGLNPRSALAFLALERLGQKRVALMMETVDDWGLKGFPLAKEPTVVGKPSSPQQMAVPPAKYAARPRGGIVVNGGSGGAEFPRIYLASGKTAPQRADGKVVHLPYGELLDANGTPKPANEIWKALVKAGVPRYAEIVCISEDLGEAAANYYLLRLMGFPDVKVQAG